MQAVMTDAFSAPEEQMKNLQTMKQKLSPILMRSPKYGQTFSPPVSPFADNSSPSTGSFEYKSRKRVSFDIVEEARPTVAPTSSPEFLSPRDGLYPLQQMANEGNPSNNPRIEDPCISPELLSDDEREGPVAPRNDLRIQSPFRITSVQRATLANSPVIVGADHPPVDSAESIYAHVHFEGKGAPSSPSSFKAYQSSVVHQSTKEPMSKSTELEIELEAERSKRKQLELDLQEIRTRSYMHIADLESQLEQQRGTVLSNSQNNKKRDDKHQEELLELMTELAQKEELIQSLQAVVTEQRGSIRTLKEQHQEVLDEDILLDQIEKCASQVQASHSDNSAVAISGTAFNDHSKVFTSQRGSRFSKSLSRLQDQIQKLNRKHLSDMLHHRKEIEDMQVHVAVQNKVVSGLHEDLRQRDLKMAAAEIQAQQQSELDRQHDDRGDEEKVFDTESIVALQEENAELGLEVQQLRQELRECQYHIACQQAAPETSGGDQRELNHEEEDPEIGLLEKETQIDFLAQELQQVNSELSEVFSKLQEVTSERDEQRQLLDKMQDFVGTLTICA